MQATGYFFILFQGHPQRKDINCFLVLSMCHWSFFLSHLQDSDVVYVPCSGLTGENLVGPCKEPLLLTWYNGPSLLDRIGIV